MDLLIGAGLRRDGVWGEALSRPITIDMNRSVYPDIVHDLDRFPWPIESESIDNVHCVDVLEHLGRQGDWRHWFSLFDELYRVVRPGGTFNCCAPRADSVWALGDPGHTRVITQEQLLYLRRPHYRQCGSTPCTDYRPYFVSDWDITRLEYTDHHFMFQMVAVKPARDT